MCSTIFTFIILYMVIKSENKESEVAQSDSLLSQGLYLPGSSMGFSREDYWAGLPFPSPGDHPNSEIKPGSPALQADS